MADRQRTRISSDWMFYKGCIQDANERDFNDKDWQSVDLPHDYSIEGPPDSNNYSWGGYLSKGPGWYRKYLPSIPDDGRRVYVEFEGVFKNSTVWVNGARVHTHPWGYTGFVIDITDALKHDGKPEVVSVFIDVDNTKIVTDPGNEGWWYEGCGIYRHVWLISTNPVHVDKWGTFVTTPKVDKQHALVNAKTTLRNDTQSEQRVTLQTTLLDPSGSTITIMSSDGVISSGSTIDIDQNADIDSPTLWSVNDPTLYSVQSKVILSGEEVDTYTTEFGIRWFEFTPDKGFFLNGEHIQLRGMDIHADCGGLGMALPDRVNYKTIEIMKQMGCNFLRSSHHDASPSLMEACDRLGMLVWAETRYLEESKTPVPALIDLIHRNRNHSSIICWGLANTAGSEDDTLTNCLKVLNEVAHAQDPTRPTAFGCEGNTDANANGFAFVTDIMGYNGGGMGIDDRDHQLYPDRKMLISEFSSGHGARGVYEEIPSGIVSKVTYGDGRVVECDGKYTSIYDLCTQFEKEWTHIAERPWLAGGAMWSGFEYYGETIGWPTITSQFGVLDICRFPKDTYYYFLQEWTDEPMVHIFPHWTWPGKEGQVIDVWGYTNCDSVRLSLNGKPLGEIPRKPLSHIEWKVPYEPGVLMAEGIIDGKVACTQETRTASEPAQIHMSVDRTSISADGMDVSFVTISIYDRDDIFVPTAGSLIDIQVTGQGRLIGLSSGDPGSHESPKGSRAKVFNGLLLAIVQSNVESGSINVTATSNGLESGRIVITAEP
ncbi:MAG: glycoside hydrolase family 2 TIM barrel-domain containing protein [Armatimonadota bacterium]